MAWGIPPSRSLGLPPRPHSWLQQLSLCSSHAGSSVDTGSFFFGAGGFDNAAVNVLRSYLKRAGGFISKDAASANRPASHPCPARRQDLPISSPIASCKRVLTKNITKVWKGAGFCLFSACVAQKQVKSLDTTKKIQWADFCSLALGSLGLCQWPGSRVWLSLSGLWDF